jgi:restriction system-associated AAA family ATPase
MKLLSLEIHEPFKSLNSGFKINFHQLTDKGIEAMTRFEPFCFAGLNGSGKSNVLEALSIIFFHLECCVAKFQPDDFEKHFRREICPLNAFTLRYLTCSHDKKYYVPALSDIVTITKKSGEEPIMYVSPISSNNQIREISLIPSERSQQRAAGKEFLPDLIVGYSSGENEILSLPFVKNRLIHFDEYREAAFERRPFYEPETSLVYIDEEMSQAVLLSCLLFEDSQTTLKPLKDELGIVGIQSFRMNINMKQLQRVDKDNPTHYEYMPILENLSERIEQLKSIASSWFESNSGEKMKQTPGRGNNILTLDFFVDINTKKAFENYFNGAFDLFRFFQVLYELNSNFIDDSIKEEVYKSKGVYTDGKLPVPGPQDNVFFFLDYKVLKKVDGIEEPIELLLREFSDGEHQFLHTMGICLMLKDRSTLLLLDEPETHFNPGWRAKFIKVLNDSLKAGGANNFLKDVILTSHSPFIISDCLPNNVIFFQKNKESNRVEAKSAKELGINTFGTSVEIILDELFNYNQSIGDWSNGKLKEIDFNSIKNESDIEQIKLKLRELGDSIEKDLVLMNLKRIKKDQ